MGPWQGVLCSYIIMDNVCRWGVAQTFALDDGGGSAHDRRAHVEATASGRGARGGAGARGERGAEPHPADQPAKDVRERRGKVSIHSPQAWQSNPKLILVPRCPSRFCTPHKSLVLGRPTAPYGQGERGGRDGGGDRG